MSTTTSPVHPAPLHSDHEHEPLTGEPGSHPVGTGLGGAGGFVAGAALGSVAGPVGTLIGAAAGAIAGGLAGKGIAEVINADAHPRADAEHDSEDAYWRENYLSRPYVQPEAPYEAYRAAYRTGYSGFRRYPGIPYHEAEKNLQLDYEQNSDGSGLTWEHARAAARDAWHRLESAVRGDSR